MYEAASKTNEMYILGSVYFFAYYLQHKYFSYNLTYTIDTLMFFRMVIFHYLLLVMVVLFMWFVKIFS